MNQRGSVILGALALCLALYAIVAQSLTALALNNRMETIEKQRLKADQELASAVRGLTEIFKGDKVNK